MKVLLVGGGAREHALAWKLRQSPHLDRLMLLPGNPGMDRLGDTVEGVAATDVGAIAALAAAQRVDLAVIGPEAPLAAGVVDALTRAGVTAFGPTRAAARLESSKAFAKEVMGRAGVPTAAAVTHTSPEPALAHLASSPGPFVVKADGLAAGKGVLVTEDRGEAASWVRRCFDGDFGEAGSRVVVEEYLDGPELSVFAVCDGTGHVTLQPARDYKRLADGDRGPNTGGMGSYSPVSLPAGLVAEVERTIIEPTMAVMATDGHPFTGFLYVGLALTAEGPRVIEFNCRLGDPETQAVLPRLDTDLLPILAGAARGYLPQTDLVWSDEATVNVVLAAAGYPEAPRTGDRIRGLDEVPDDVLVFHAGTRRQEGRIVTAGGRVLSVVGRGPDLAAARAAAYRGIDLVGFDGRMFRSDIAAQA
ncbi:MAG TPA: phosphoribosylamine--glycine ligase [Acidimicrobiia bacterium]|nr:phosphoribosylamine--glycine ligase [Acidimicrobiia bacterium]